ncbi:hypothetical protein [Sphingobacterium sp. ML3W]|uniref:hypothetical protein n=1 Tax=Sphingobacterium sp. ML3W TaxID=1538644 RepID=UPI000A6F0A68|nr:hypothetical protein [Sphingobacterium sp. ML3W]
MGISLLLFATAAMLFKSAYATVASTVSLWLMSIGILLVLVALTVFALYFKE